jgi:hypothetical protein
MSVKLVGMSSTVAILASVAASAGILVWGGQLAERGVRRTRASGAGRRTVTWGRLIPGAVALVCFGSLLAIVLVASAVMGPSLGVLWLVVPLALVTMWAASATAGALMRLRDLRDEPDDWLDLG